MSRVLSSISASALLVAAGLSGSSMAAVSYSTSFESPFTTGALAGQQGWVTSAAGGSTAMQVASTPGLARTGSQYVTYNTNVTLGTQWQWFEPQAQTAADLADPANSIVRASVWVNVYSASAASGVTRISYAGLDCYDITGSTRLGFIRVASNGFVQINNGSASSLQASITGFSLNQWNKVTIEFDYAADKIRWYFNDALITPTAGYDTFLGTTFGDADVFGSRSTATGTTTGGHTLLWDDYSVQTVPAPGALALLGVAGLVGARRRR
jgi:MYXO-CTERM domain-containing protein